MRALEVIELTGEPKAARLPDEPRAVARRIGIVHLRSDRARLVERLDARVARDVAATGSSTRCAGCVPQGIERGVTARKAIGYAQALGELHGRMSRGRRDRRDAAAHAHLRAPAGGLVQALPRCGRRSTPTTRSARAAELARQAALD